MYDYSVDHNTVDVKDIEDNQKKINEKEWYQETIKFIKQAYVQIFQTKIYGIIKFTRSLTSPVNVPDRRNVSL